MPTLRSTFLGLVAIPLLVMPFRPGASAVDTAQASLTPNDDSSRIDRTILARLKQKENPSEADKKALLRRLHLDLTGIPPTPAELEAFLADQRPEAYEETIDRLLASSVYGDRWGQYGLESARSADTLKGPGGAGQPRSAHRDAVIKAFNEENPLDRFIRNRLADNQTRPALSASNILQQASEIELFSLDPARREKRQDGFHGWKVLGKTVIKSEAERKALLDSLRKGVASSDGGVADCFNPRHGLRARHAGESVELVICFECLSIQVYFGPTSWTILTTAEPQATVDNLLKMAGVPLAAKVNK